MNVRVKTGTVKCNNAVYKEGDVFKAPVDQVDSLVNAGVVEVVKEEPKPEPKKEPEKKPEPKKEPKPEKEEPKVEEPEPTMEWTHKELVEYAGKKGVEVDPSMTKKEILEALKGGEKSEYKTN